MRRCFSIKYSLMLMNNENLTLVECERHGKRGVTLVCQHIARAVDSDECVGFSKSLPDTESHSIGGEYGLI